MARLTFQSWICPVASGPYSRGIQNQCLDAVQCLGIDTRPGANAQDAPHRDAQVLDALQHVPVQGRVQLQGVRVQPTDHPLQLSRLVSVVTATLRLPQQDMRSEAVPRSKLLGESVSTTNPR